MSVALGDVDVTATTMMHAKCGVEVDETEEAGNGWWNGVGEDISGLVFGQTRSVKCTRCCGEWLECLD